MSRLEFSSSAALMRHADRLKQARVRELAAGQRTARAGDKGHLHYNERGYWVRCYHRSRTAVLSWGFWIGMTLGFPLEHLLWERAPGFSWITHLLGL